METSSQDSKMKTFSMLSGEDLVEVEEGEEEWVDFNRSSKTYSVFKDNKNSRK